MRAEAVVLESMKGRISALLRGNDFGCAALLDEPMSGHTTLRIGGPTDVYVTPRDIGSLRRIVTSLKDEGAPFMPLGGGSNLLVSDEGIAGAVISTVYLSNIEMLEEDSDSVTLFAESGTPLQRLVSLSREKGYKGIEGLAGIPGFLGGAIRGNSGSFGYEIGDVVLSVTATGRGGQALEIEREGLGLGYRSTDLADGIVLIGATLRLLKDDPGEVAKRTADFLSEKRKKQPISERSAGCVFKNPAGMHAAKLIDDSGCKGMRRGDIEVSGLHANFFINSGKGTAEDFLGLMDSVRESVMKKFGIELEPEIKIIGRGRAS